MAYGSADYWMTKSEYLTTVYNAMLAFMKEDGSVVTALDSLDGKFDNVITLDQLSGEQLTLLAAMLGVNVSLISEGDIPAAIDMLDNVLDGKLDLNQLSNALIMRELIASIVQLTAMVAAQGSAVTALGSVLTAMNSSLTKLDTQIGNLVTIKSNTNPLLEHFDGDIQYIAEDPVQYHKFRPAMPTRYNCRVYAHIDNPGNIWIGYADGFYPANIKYILSAGEVIDTTSLTELWVYFDWAYTQTVIWRDTA